MTHLYAKNRLWQTVATHDVGQVFQDVVKDVVQFLPHDGQSLLGRELSCERLGLMRHKNQRSRTPWPPTETRGGLTRSIVPHMYTILRMKPEKTEKNVWVFQISPLQIS